MVNVAQSVEPRIVIPVVAGSSPVVHPISNVDAYQNNVTQLSILINIIQLALLGIVAYAFIQQKKTDHTELFRSEIERLQKGFKEDFHLLRDGLASEFKRSRDEQNDRMEKTRDTVEKRLTLLQEDNSKKLEQMRATVDEKLQSTLEKRLGESFKQVSDRLELVHKGLGEMKQLANGVGDLKKVLTNVKTRGTWGEVQLGSILEQILSPEQYEKNVRTKEKSNMQVEYAIKLPGKDTENNSPVWLPIDAKFPQDMYLHLIDAQERADIESVESAAKQLEIKAKFDAREIRDKYLDPPNTTDFGIMFVPTEGLYAELLRRPGLQQLLQNDYRILLAGPTTLAALLNSLQMGFRTLAIEKRSSEVWSLLSTVKSEFGKFGNLLEKTKKKLQEAGNNIDFVAQKSRNIERKLNKVQDLPNKAVEELENDENSLYGAHIK